jgi:NTP pyrophosphatase (non-canonical NTP hydrolase)
MNNILKKIEELSIKEKSRQGIFQLLAKSAEELGELSTAILTETSSFGCDKELSESANYEAVDLAIMALCIYFTNDGKLEDLEKMFSEKLSKWEGKFKEQAASQKEEKQLHCDKDIYQNGDHIYTTHSIPPEEMEQFVKMVAWHSGQRVDWHFYAGRAVVKAIGDIEKVKASIKLFEPKLEAIRKDRLKSLGID